MIPRHKYPYPLPPPCAMNPWTLTLSRTSGLLWIPEWWHRQWCSFHPSPPVAGSDPNPPIPHIPFPPPPPPSPMGYELWTPTLSRTSGLLVDPSMMTPSVELITSISTSSWFRVPLPQIPFLSPLPPFQHAVLTLNSYLIQDVRSVGGPQHDDTVSGAHSIHLHQ